MKIGPFGIGKRGAAIAALIGGALLVAAVAVYAWDRSRSDLIADGVRVGGVDLGGITRAEARAVLDSDLVDPLARPVKVRFQDRTHRITRKRLRLEADVDGMLDEAIAVSREGGVPGRLWRAVTGGELTRDLRPRVSYSKKALRVFVAELGSEIDQPARDADVQPAGTSLEVVPAREGIGLRRQQLVRRIQAELEAPAGGRVVKATARTIKPKVTTDQLASKYPYFVTVDRSSFTLRFWKSLKMVKSYRISVGQIGYDTPAGLYHVQNKQVDPTWHVPNSDWAGKLAGKVIPGGRSDNPLKSRWMGIYNGAGIHGTDSVGSLGRAASHGCIRMAIPDVIELYDQIPVQTPIYIA